MSAFENFSSVISVLPLVTIVLGITGNLACVFIFRFSRQFSKIPSMVFLSFVAVFDTISLFEWNLDHFLVPNFGIRLEFMNTFNCKFIVFIQVYSLQASAFLLSIMAIDRYVTISSIPGSIYSRLPFSTIKSSFIWSVIISVSLFLLNCHILIFNGNYIKIREKNSTLTRNINGTLEAYFKIIRRKEKCYWYTSDFRFYPTIDHVNLIVYNFVPFLIMAIFNILLIKKNLLSSGIKSHSVKKISSSLLSRRRLTISLLSITFAFIFMTLPSSIAYGFFAHYNKNKFELIFRFLDNVAFLFHSSLFFNCFISNTRFRRYCCESIEYFRKKKNFRSTMSQNFSKY